MKKIFLVIIIFIVVLFVVDINNFDNKMYDKITKGNVYVDEIYIYGRYFNIKGHADFNLDEAFLIFVDSTFNETKYDLSVNENKFYLSDKINGGLNLEDIKYDNSTILLMSNDKYYPLINNSNYENTDYYTISNFNKTNYLEFVFSKFKDVSFLKLKCKNILVPNDVYDIVIDPGHGGADVGAVSGNIYESNISLSISNLIKKKLEDEGFKIKLTREDDSNPGPYGEGGRATIPYEVKAKIFLSVHVNSTPHSIISGGTEVYASPNMNYDFAYNIASKIKEYANSTYSSLQLYKVKDGVYVKNLSKQDIEEARESAKNSGYTYYENVTTNTPWYFYNRETGGYMTGAYMDGRNKVYPANPYYNSNMGIEGYLLELGYITCKNDLNNLINNQDGYAKGITKAIVEELK
jgi:N-acetylmuramoyl-L-alanine amidase